MLKEIGSHIVAPINRFFIVAVGLLAYIAVRSIRTDLTYPPLLIGGLAAAAVGALVMVALDARRTDRAIAPTLAYTVAGGLIVAAITFALAWLLVVPTV